MSHSKLSLIQFTLLIYKAQIGLNLLWIPRLLLKEADTDGWILLILACIVAILMGGIMIIIMRVHPDLNLYDLLQRYLGKWLGNGVILFWIVYGWSISTVTFLTTLYLINVWILPNTSIYFTAILLLIPIYMVIHHGIPMMARYAEFVFIVLFFVPLLMLFSMRDVEWNQLLPILKQGWEPILSGIQTVIPVFFGFELAFFWYPFLKKKGKAFQGMLVANLLTLFVLLITTLVSFITFSPEEIIQMVWPTVNLLKFIQFPFLERLEVIVLSLYIYVLLATVIPYLYIALVGLKKVREGGSQNEQKISRKWLFFTFGVWLMASIFYYPTLRDLLQVITGLMRLSIFIVPTTIALCLVMLGVRQRKQVKGL